MYAYIRSLFFRIIFGISLKRIEFSRRIDKERNEEKIDRQKRNHMTPPFTPPQCSRKHTHIHTYILFIIMNNRIC